jgi:hypothetical protein
LSNILRTSRFPEHESTIAILAGADQLGVLVG